MNVERGRFFVVEGTQAFVAVAEFSQSNIVANYLDNINGGFQLFNEVSCHDLSLSKNFHFRVDMNVRVSRGQAEEVHNC